MTSLWQHGTEGSRLPVKVCGITRQADLDEAGRLGVSALGLNFFSRSPRFITHLQANTLLARWPHGVEAVGLLVQPDREMVQALLEAVPALGWLQFHGLEQPPEWPVPRPWIVAFAPKTTEDLAAVSDWLRRAKFCPTPPSAVLVDGHSPGMAGGTGITAPWNLLKYFQPEIPWILAGGLNPGNISQALRQLHPQGIDVASGVEESPGIKSARKMADLMRLAGQARRA